MTLEDIKKAAKRDGKISQLEQEFSEDNSGNVTPAIAEIFGDNSYREQGYEPSDFLHLTSAANRDVLNRAVGDSRSNLVEQVQGMYVGAIRELAKGDEGPKRVAQVLVNLDPVEDLGFEAIYKAHKKLRDAVSAVKDPAKDYPKALKKIKTPTMQYAVDVLSNLRPEMIEVRAKRVLSRASQDVVEALGGSGRSAEYLRELYEAADEDTQRAIAYAIGKAL